MCLFYQEPEEDEILKVGDSLGTMDSALCTVPPSLQYLRLSKYQKVWDSLSPHPVYIFLSTQPHVRVCFQVVARRPLWSLYTVSSWTPGHLPHGLSYREGRREMVVESFKLTDMVKVRILFDISPIWWDSWWLKWCIFGKAIQFLSYPLDKFCLPFSRHIAYEVDEISILHSVTGKHCYLPWVSRNLQG